jgi:tetratricopeptide (TPR) repeat protein
VSITRVEAKIATSQESLSLLHRSRPEYLAHLQILALARSARHRLLHQKEDLDKAILHYTEAILLRHISGLYLDSVQTIYYLSLALLDRSEGFEQPEGIKYSVEYLRCIRRFPLDSFVTITDVTTLLIRALCAQVVAGAGNWTQDINEMVALCNELLSSRKSEVVPTPAFNYLGEAVTHAELRHRIPTEIIDEVIECLRDSVKVCPPSSYKVMNALAFILSNRFVNTNSKEDCEEATVLLEKILEPGGCPDSFRGMPSSLAIVLAHGRSLCFREPEYSAVAISRLRAGSSSPSLNEMLRLSLTSSLEIQNRIRFDEYSLDESLEEAISCTSQLVNASTSSSLEESAYLFSCSEAVQETYSATDIQQKIEDLENLLSITPPGTDPYIICLVNLERFYKSKFRRTSDIADLEAAIKYSRLLLDATRVGTPSKIGTYPLFNLCNILSLAFQQTGNINYLDESITIGYDILEFKTAQTYFFSIIQLLVASLLTREQLFGRMEDYLEAIRLMSVVINNKYGQAPDRFRLACEWAIVARNTHHPTTLAAYQSAMSLMERSMSFAPTVSVQHTRFISMGENCQTMPLDYASYQIDLGQFDEAVEALEHGRALLWSEMRGFRTPMAQLIEEDPSLTKKFAGINQELEALTVSITPSGRPKVEDSVHQSKNGTDPFGRLVIKRKKLVEERDALISQIRSRPGLEGFLGAPTFDTLRSAASRGPVIIINHCAWRSDIMIIFHNYLPCSIPTSETFFSFSKKLRDKLVEARKKGLDSVEYQHGLSSVLKGLYELVGEPVIKRLRLLGIPEQSRIWWCPTSVFCSLPLHAMGPIPSENGRERYFSDLYIPSYTPSLSALIESRQANVQIPKKPSLLLVAQPDDLLPGVRGEIKVIQRALKGRLTMESLVSGEATPPYVLEGLRGSQLAHFACHGVLETGRPFDASFKLHKGSRLTLLDIVRSRLPDAEFAFLSCCHAAEITEESVADEALHLTAAMQYCGFRSVVGTMWEMADVDGRDLAKSFYKSLLSNQDSIVPYSERSAEALRDATQKLRGKRGISLERWVNFVHYGA